MKPILEIQNISKKFRIGGDSGGYKTLRDNLFPKDRKKKDKTEFWALQDVSFDVFPGDTIGIIGKNGAGKSTLLKILSRITPPTKGKIICRGRIASLLEVGTGFHGELSGKENIYLNGSILGLKKTEINKKFDEIVDFSGVEKFLDTQLKHYSSGMQLRLAFAVAAHLEPEILIIDEVLAVGDAEFQRKCLGKMEEVGNSGRTIIFVSHNLPQLQSICKQGILLEHGSIKFNGKTNKTITEYLRAKNAEGVIDVINMPKVIKSDLFQISSFRFKKNKDFFEQENIEMIICFIVTGVINELNIGFSLSDLSNNLLIECRSSGTYPSYDVKPGEYEIALQIKPQLKNGVYYLSLGANCSSGNLEYIPHVAEIEILPTLTNIELWKNNSNGLLITNSTWSINQTK